MDNLSFVRCSVNDIREFVETHHYSKSINGVKISYCFALMKDDQLAGAMIFGHLSTTAWKRFGVSESDVLELRRLVTTDDCVRNAESWFIAKAIKWLKENTNIKTLVSYADPYHDHVGYVYQASNWVYEGTTKGDIGLKTPDGKIYHSRSLRVKYNGEYKPFVKQLRQMNDDGLLEKVLFPGKHTYTYSLRHKNINLKKYPNMKNFFDELKEKNTARQIEWDADQQFDLSYHTLEFMTESGELGEQVKKLIRQSFGAKGNTTDLVKIAEEVGDVMITLDKLLTEIENRTGVRLKIEDCTKDKFNKTSDKYGFKTKF